MQSPTGSHGEFYTDGGAESSEIRRLSEPDLDALLELRKVAFPGVALEEDEMRKVLGRRLPYSYGLFVDGRLAGAYALYPIPVHFAGIRMEIGALAGVASAIEFRRRGHIRELLLGALSHLRERNVGWCLEYPFDPRFYARLGWQSLPSGVDMELPARLLFAGRPPRARRLPLDQIESLAALYRPWAQGFNFTFTREFDPRGSWERLRDPLWLDGDAFLYELEDAYLLLTLSREEGKLVATVEDYAYATPVARRRLLRFLGSLEGQAELVRITLPSEDPLVLDFGRSHARKGRSPLQARIAHIGSALAPLASRSPASFRLRVEDRLCPWNDGLFEIELSPQGCSARRTEGSSVGSADASLPVTTLPLLLTDTLSGEAAVRLGLADGDSGALDSLTAVAGGLPTFLPVADAF